MAARTAWLAGATGVIGRALLPRLLASDRFTRVDVLARRPEDAAGSPRLHAHRVDFAALAAALQRADDVCIPLGTTIKVNGSRA